MSYGFLFSGGPRNGTQLFYSKLMTMLRYIKCLFVFIFFSTATIRAQGDALAWVSKTGARSFPSSVRTFYVNDYGAVANGKTVVSQAIQKAIDACAARGGGIVAFKPGTYVM